MNGAGNRATYRDCGNERDCGDCEQGSKPDGKAGSGILSTYQPEQQPGECGNQKAFGDGDQYPLRDPLSGDQKAHHSFSASFISLASNIFLSRFNSSRSTPRSSRMFNTSCS